MQRIVDFSCVLIRRMDGMGRQLISMCLILGVWIFATLTISASESTDPVTPLGSIDKILRLKPAEAAKGYAVKLRAVVSFNDNSTNGLYIHDSSGGISISDLAQTDMDLQAGTTLEIEGITKSGRLCPTLSLTRVIPQGPGRLPDPQPVDYYQLMQGFEDGQWVEARGLVRSINFGGAHAQMTLDGGPANFQAYVHQIDNSLTNAPWLGARVRLPGVCRNLANDRGQLAGFVLLIPHLADIAIEEPGVKDAFSLPVVPIRDILKYRHSSASNQLVHVQGAITRQRLDYSIHIKDSSASLYVRTAQKTLFKVGDFVDVIGFVAFDRIAPCVENGMIRKTKEGPSPLPIRITPDQARHYSFDSELVQMEGNLVDIKKDPPFRSLTLLKDTSLFDAVLEEDKWPAALNRIRKGSLIRVTGIYIVKIDESRTPRVYQIALRDAGDVETLKSAPWWTQTYAATGAKLLLGLALATSIWVVLLRRRVAQQTRRIREEVGKEAALEARYRSLVEAANDAIFSVDPHSGQILDANRRAGEMVGVGLSQLVGGAFWNLAPPDRTESWRQFFQRVMESGSGIHETLLQSRDGQRSIAVEISANATEIDKRKIIHAIFHDLTAYKRSEAALRASEASLLRTQDIGKVGSWELDVVTRNLRWSPEAERIFGGSRRNTPPNLAAVEAMVHPEDRKSFQDALAEALRIGRGFNVDHRLLLPDGSLRVVRSMGEVQLDAAGHPARILGATQDITEHKALEADLRQAQKMEAVGRLAAGVAHDFNNIMTIIQGNASLVLNTGILDDEQVLSLREISKASERASNLTQQLLAFGRRQVMQVRLLDLNDVVTRVSGMLQRLIGENVAIQMQLKAPELWVEADQGMMDQVLVNLALNARDAMPRGGRLTIGTKVIQIDEKMAMANQTKVAPGRYACVEVADNGSGMTSEVINHLFEPFFTTKEVGKGTGLGLAAVYGAIRQHHGWIEVTSEVGQGSVFRYFLPISDKQPPALAAPAASSEIRRGQETILVVEDEPALRAMVRSLLSKYGYQVIQAGNGVDALRIVQENHRRIDLVLTDMVMPGGLTGSELTTKLQSLKPGLKVILTSGYSSDIPEQVLNDQESVKFLPKPYHPADLAKLIRECLDNPGQRSA